MKSKIKHIFLAAVVMLMVAQPAFADLVFCGKKGDPTPCTLGDLFSLVYIIVNYLVGMAGLVAILFVVWGGLQMLMSGGDPTKIKDGKSTIWHAILGLILVLLAYLIVGYVAALLLPASVGSGDPLRGLVNFIIR